MLDRCANAFCLRRLLRSANAVTHTKPAGMPAGTATVTTAAEPREAGGTGTVPRWEAWRDSPLGPKREAASNTFCTWPSPPWRVLSSASLGHGKGGAETREGARAMKQGQGQLGAARGQGQGQAHRS
eukprot:scaffold53712_cov40-Phaeocystis_antarctica.AAC.2